MPIKWSALKVSEAMDMAEEFVNQVREPLESAKLTIEEAKKLPKLPEYMIADLRGVEGEIERVLGSYQTFSQIFYEGSIHRAIGRVRRDLPKDAIKAETERAKLGNQQSLV